jgi:hypothetical protein
VGVSPIGLERYGLSKVLRGRVGAGVLQLPEPPQPVDHRVVGVEHRVAGGDRNLAHRAADPDVHVVMDLLDLLAEIHEIGRRKHGSGLGHPLVTGHARAPSFS